MSLSFCETFHGTVNASTCSYPKSASFLHTIPKSMSFSTFWNDLFRNNSFFRFNLMQAPQFSCLLYQDRLLWLNRLIGWCVCHTSTYPIKGIIRKIATQNYYKAFLVSVMWISVCFNEIRREKFRRSSKWNMICVTISDGSWWCEIVIEMVISSDWFRSSLNFELIYLKFWIPICSVLYDFVNIETVYYDLVLFMVRNVDHAKCTNFQPSHKR